MEAFSAQGTCLKCAAFTRAVGATREDAILFLSHEHGLDHGHAFEGETTETPTSQDEFVSRGTPKRTRR